MDPIVAYLIKIGAPLTVSAYVQLNWMGDKTVDDLEGEEVAEIESLLEEHQLCDSPSNYRN